MFWGGRGGDIWVLKMLMLGWFWRVLLNQKMRSNICSFAMMLFFPPWSVSMGPWYPFSYMIAMNIDLYGQLSDWFILWIIIHAYEADRSCVNTVTIDMNSKDCWYEHVIVNMNINITQMNECSMPWTTNVILMNWWSLIWKSTFILDQLTLLCHHERFHDPYWP